MIVILPQTHKIIATNLYESIKNIHGFELDLESLKKGAVLPDFHPKYRLIRHYKEESIDYITLKILFLIFSARYLNVDTGEFKDLTNKVFSRKLGIIAHYLSDYTCLPHYERWTCDTMPMDHIKYEVNLNRLANSYDFSSLEHHRIENIETDTGLFELNDSIKKFIDHSLVVYGEKRSPKRDLKFALALTTSITSYILESVEAYNNLEEYKLSLDLQFV